MISTRDGLLKALLAIQERISLSDAENKALDMDTGICLLVEDYFPEDTNVDYLSDMQDHMNSFFKTWPGFSGDIDFPIAGRHEYMHNHNLWTGESGEKRRSLLKYMISEITGR